LHHIGQRLRSAWEHLLHSILLLTTAEVAARERTT
jgi:hypothetical protein